MPLSEHVYCVAVAFKMTELVEQRISNTFCVKLEHSFTETIQMILRPQLWATGDWQLYYDNMLLRYHVPCRGFWQNIKSAK